MLAFLDTEFTDLVVRPRLLSVGIVTDTGREFYAEVTDADRLDATGWFGRDVVLPQFGQVPNAACTHVALGARLCGFLAALAQELVPGEFIELAYGHHLDWDLVDLAIRSADVLKWVTLRQHIQPVNVYQLTGHGAGRLASEAYFEAQAHAPITRHHALCDAHALRLAHEAVSQVAEADRASPQTAVA